MKHEFKKGDIVTWNSDPVKNADGVTILKEGQQVLIVGIKLKGGKRFLTLGIPKLNPIIKKIEYKSTIGWVSIKDVTFKE